MSAAKQSSKYALSISVPSGLSSDDIGFLKTAMCVPDGDYNYTGIPDKEDAPSNVRHTVVEYDLDMSVYNSATPSLNGTTVEIVWWPWERPEVMAMVSFQKENTVAGFAADETQYIMTGGVGIYIQSAGNSVFATDGTATTPLNANSINSNAAGEVLCASDTFTVGERGRVVGQWLEIFHTGSQVYATGEAVSWEQTQRETDAKYNALANNTGTGSFIDIDVNASGNSSHGTYGLVHKRYPMPPSSNTFSQNLFKSENWERITDGCFMPAHFDLDECDAVIPNVLDKVLDWPTAVSPATGNSDATGGYGWENQSTNQRYGLYSGSFANQYLMGASNTGFNEASANNPRNYHTSKTMKGIRMTGLNNNSGGSGANASAATFKILLHTVFESFPDGSNLLTISQCRKSPAYNPMALEAYFHLSQAANVSYPVSWNASKDYDFMVKGAINQAGRILSGQASLGKAKGVAGRQRGPKPPAPKKQQQPKPKPKQKPTKKGGAPKKQKGKK
jgi:hypothetical protein